MQMVIHGDKINEVYSACEERKREGRGGYIIAFTDPDHAFLFFGQPEKKKVEFTISGLTTGGDLLRSEYIARKELEHILAALSVENRLALEVSLATGLRISDVLALKTEQVRNAKGGRVSVREMKTGKYRRVYIRAELMERMLRIAGKLFVFPHRLDYRKHRTRQAVYKDITRVAKLFRIKEHVSPHSCRKVFAVNFYHKCGGDMGKVRKLLNHENEAVTMIYALADVLHDRHYNKNKCSD